MMGWSVKGREWWLMLPLLGSLTLVGCASIKFGESSEGDSGRDEDAPGQRPGQLPGGAYSGAQEACEEELERFDQTVLQPLLAVRCVGCHNAQGAAAGTRMVLRLDPAALAENYDAVAAVAADQSAGKPQLLLKPTGAHPDGHGGGMLVAAGSREEAALAAFVAQVTTSVCDPGGAVGESCEEAEPGAAMLRRLSRKEYQNSVEDLLGIPSEAGRRFAADTVVHGFDNNAKVLTVAPLLADQIAGEAERLAALAMQAPAALLPCASSEGRACAETFVRSFGRRAYRRPLTDDEVGRYMTVYAAGSSDAGFEGGVELVISTMLQAPGFLYRTELGEPDASGGSTLTQYEVASELSYALTASPPDDALLDAAERGELASPEGRRTHAERLLDSPRGRAQVASFVRKWIDVERLLSVPKDAELFGDFDESIREAMAQEIDRFVEYVVYEGDGSLSTLLSAPYTFVNAQLAQFYQVPPPEQVDASGFGRVSALDPERAGLLTLGGVLTTHARPDGSSPVHRGKLVRERVLCQEVAPPPPGVVVEPPPVDPSLSVRERYAAHSAQEPCQSCHRLLDPIGLGLEHFDGVGRYREAEGVHAIDASGEIVQSERSDGEFDGAPELADLLRESAEVSDCFALQWFRYAYGVEEDQRLSCLLNDLQDQFGATGGDIRSLLLASVQTPHITSRGQAQALTNGPQADPPQDGAEDPPEDEEDDPASDANDGPTAPAPPPQDGATADTVGVTHELVVDSSWETGHCDAVTVKNTSDSPVAWQISLELDGTITNAWNCTPSGDSGTVQFKGADWNRELAPGAEASFGYCIER